jgi:hypothetical protein
MKPFCCPVCQGRGTVPGGFYSCFGGSTSITAEPCRPCSGTGIVWVDENEISVPSFQTLDDSDPRSAAFVGPLGRPATHEERAAIFNLNYRPVPDEPTRYDCEKALSYEKS